MRRGSMGHVWAWCGGALLAAAGCDKIVLGEGDNPGVHDRAAKALATDTGGDGPGPAAETTFELVAYNAHLAGDSFVDSWADQPRADWISRTWMGDLDWIAYEEVWDDDDIWRPYLRYHYDDSMCCSFTGFKYKGNLEHSGLAMRSRFEMLDARQREYHNGAGFEYFAAKGWLEATIIKDGLAIGVFNTHMQSDYYDSAIIARRKQMKQLAKRIREYQADHPSRPVVAIGDYNVYGEDVKINEYSTTFTDLMLNGANLRDVTHDPDVRDFTYTWDQDGNTLTRYFYPDNEDGPSGRLDYILIGDSRNARVRVEPLDYAVLIPLAGQTMCDEGHCDRNLSDHYPVWARLRVYGTP